MFRLGIVSEGTGGLFMVSCLVTIWGWFFVTAGMHASAPTLYEHAHTQAASNAGKSLGTPALPPCPSRTEEFARTDAEIETFEDEFEPAVDSAQAVAFTRLVSARAFLDSLAPFASSRAMQIFLPSGIVHPPMRC